MSPGRTGFCRKFHRSHGAWVQVLRRSKPSQMESRAHRSSLRTIATVQALLRVLPAAAWVPAAVNGDTDGFYTFVAECLALTHGGRAAVDPTIAALGALGSLVYADEEAAVFDAHRVRWMVEQVVAPGSRPGSLFDDIDQPPADKSVLLQLAADSSTRSVVVAGLYAAASHPRPEQAMEALHFCRFDASQSKAVAAFTGALLGACVRSGRLRCRCARSSRAELGGRDPRYRLGHRDACASRSGLPVP